MPELVWHERHLVGFENRLKDENRRDEAFTRELVWHRSSLLIAAERDGLENEFVEVTTEEAGWIVDGIRRSVTT